MTAEPENRTGQGRFAAGRSGNPGGRPKGFAELQLAAREHTKAALKALADALDDPKLKVAAATALLDRGYGKPAQALTGASGGALTIVIKKYTEEEDDQ